MGRSPHLTAHDLVNFFYFTLPKTFLSRSVVRATGFSRIFFSSAATILKRLSRFFS